MRKLVAADNDLVKVVLSASGVAADLASEAVSTKFDLTRSDAQKLLSSGYGVIADSFPVGKAQAARSVLAAFGVEIDLQDLDTKQTPEKFDISVRVSDPSTISNVQHVLVQSGWSAAVHFADFGGPAGMEICDISEKQAKQYASKLQKIDGVTVTLCSRGSARFIVFPPAGLPKAEEARIRRHVSRMGHSAPEGLCAVAIGLMRNDLILLQKCFPNAGLFGVNQAFSRFDVTVVDVGASSIEDYAKFHHHRGGATALAALAGRKPRVETNITLLKMRMVYEEFSAMGIKFRVDLVSA